MKRLFFIALSLALSLQAAMAQQQDFQWNKSRQTQSVVSGRFTRSLSVPNGPVSGLPIWVADTSKRGSLYVQTVPGQTDKLVLWDSNTSTWVDVSVNTADFLRKTGGLQSTSANTIFNGVLAGNGPNVSFQPNHLYLGSSDTRMGNLSVGKWLDSLAGKGHLAISSSGSVFNDTASYAPAFGSGSYIQNTTASQSGSNFNIDGIGRASQFRASAYFAGTPGVGNWTQATPGSVSFYTTSANANITHTGTDLVFNNTYGKFLFNNGFVYDAPNGNLGLGTASPNTGAGRVLHLLNTANTGNVASNTTLILESQNRNTNVYFRVGSGSGGLLFQNLAGSTNLAQFSMNQTAGYPALGIITNGFTNMGFNTNGTNETNMYGQLNIGGSTKFSGSLNEVFGPIKQILTLTGTTTGVYVPGTSLVANMASVGNGVDPKGGSTLFVSANDQDGVTGATAPMMMGVQIAMNPKFGRMLSGIDDAVGVNVKNVSQTLSWLTEFFYIGSNAAFKAAGVKEARAAFNVDANVDIVLGYTGSGVHGFDTYVAPGYTATFSGSAVRLGNGHRISARNAAGTQDITIARINSSDQIEFYNGIATLNSTGQLAVPSIGHTTNGSSLVLNSNYGATKARIYFGATTLNSYFDELNNRLNINNTGGLTERFTVTESVAGLSGIKAIMRLTNNEGSGSIFGSYYNSSGVVTSIDWRATGSKDITISTTGKQSAITVRNAGGVELASTVTHAGVINPPTAPKTANYNTTENDNIIRCNSTGGSFNVVLLSTAVAGQQYTIDNTSGTANNVIIKGTINGLTDYTLGATKTATLYKTDAATNTWTVIFNN